MPLKLTKTKPAGTKTKTEGTATVEKEIKNTGKTVAETSDQEQVEVPAEVAQNTVAGTPAVVAVDMSYTHNLGNYQSARVGVSISIPCLHDEVDQVFEFGKSWCEERLNGMVEEIVAQAEAE